MLTATGREYMSKYKGAAGSDRNVPPKHNNDKSINPGCDLHKSVHTSGRLIRVFLWPMLAFKERISQRMT